MYRKLAFAAAAGLMVFLAGYWSGHSATVHAQGGDRVFELRVYHANEGKLDDLLKRFRDHTITIFNRYDMTSIGYWVPMDEPLKGRTLYYMLAFPSREAAAKSWGAFRADPEWKKVSAASDAHGKLVQKVDSTFLTPTDFSPIK
jgi:NIPSNAP